MTLVNYLFPLLLFFAILFTISKHACFKKSPFSSQSLQFAFFIRAFSSLLVYYLYSEYYPVREEADTFKYFDDSYFMAQALWEHPGDFLQMLLGIECDTAYFHETYFNHMSNWVRSYDNGLFNDNRLVIRANAFIRIFSFGNYHIHALVFNFIAFLGCLSLGKVFFSVSQSKLKSYLVVFLIPSVVFWSSGIFKESILLFAMGTFLHHFYEFSRGNGNTKRGLVLLLMSGILIVMKLYVFAAFLPACICYYFAKKRKSIIWVYTLVFSVFLLLGWIVGVLNPQYSFIHLIVDKQRDFINLSQFFEVNSAFQMDYLKPTLGSLLKACPEAILNVLTKPWLGEINSPLFVPPLIENLMFLLTTLFCFIWRQKAGKGQLNFIVFCLSFALVMSAVIGLTTPITGALVRYKIPMAPFVWMAVLMLINTHKFPKGFKKTKIYQWIHTYL